MIMGWANDVEKVRAKLRQKRRQHGQPGVPIGRELHCGTMARRWPRLWINPWAEHPLEASFGLPLACPGMNGAVDYIDQPHAPAAIFGLGEIWPGPEGPFEKQ